MVYNSVKYNANLNDFELSINNKLIDKTKINIKKTEYSINAENQNNIDDFFMFKKSNVLAKPYRSDLFHVVISSDVLGLKFSELNNIIFQTNGNKKEIWEIKKFANPVKEYYIEANNNEANFKIAERYLFEFGELNNDVIDFKTYYIDNNVKFNKLTFNNNIEIASSKSIINAEKYWNKNTFFIFDEYKRIWNQYQSLSKNELNSFSGEHWQNLSKLNLQSELISSLYNSNNEQKKYVYNWPTEYNYKTGIIQDGYNFDNKGLFVPYNFKGNLKTTYNYIFDNGGSNNNNDLIKIHINNTQHIENRILNPNDGLIRLNIEQEQIKVEKLKYSFNANDIEKIIKNKPNNIDFFNNFQINEQEKNSYTIG
ncbi:hypothetical protein EG856_02940 [Mycoplasmopsis phocirhinis]|uniref:Uncharacterized protein n=2 Tax=Mycoplasmopsis phocirhinis TaxID=142650 RepID=A0A4P6MP46_9BACT|nr:hypothetical protein [Mycoplasmopsis phocirhinis]QBF34853.1 hypothetical protein EG856_02940 [Mycoplasmopsis phocirhinis]